MQQSLICSKARYILKCENDKILLLLKPNFVSLHTAFNEYINWLKDSNHKNTKGLITNIYGSFVNVSSILGCKVNNKTFSDLFKTQYDYDLNTIIIDCLAFTRTFFGNQERKILPGLYQFEFQSDEYSIPGFMANLRLCNRSVKRLIANNKPFEKYELLSKQRQFRGCQFPTSPEIALDIQEVTNKGNRVDHVINNGTYSDIDERIKSIKKGAKVNDKDIAHWIRQTFYGEPLLLTEFNNIDEDKELKAFHIKEIKRAIVGITYQLFGTEVVRNPASFIHHHMMLELIIKGSCTWNDFLKNTHMLPMEMTDAVKGARTLHAAYNSSMPYPYMYPKGLLASLDSVTVRELISKEGALTFAWLKQQSSLREVTMTPKTDNSPNAIEKN